jgi:hypothetical protein
MAPGMFDRIYQERGEMLWLMGMANGAVACGTVLNFVQGSDLESYIQ